MKQLLFRTLLVVVVAGILARSVASIVWQGWFYTHQKEITASSCINKAKPSLQCNGKCQLAKQLKAIEQSNDKEQNMPLSVFKLPQTDWIIPIAPSSEICADFYFILSETNLFKSLTSNEKHITNLVFRPPIEFLGYYYSA